eukprot:scaffold2534_cov260-Pinguiococcus_pyrenoidosus.AAC.34
METASTALALSYFSAMNQKEPPRKLSVGTQAFFSSSGYCSLLEEQQLSTRIVVPDAAKCSSAGCSEATRARELKLSLRSRSSSSQRKPLSNRSAKRPEFDNDLHAER